MPGIVRSFTKRIIIICNMAVSICMLLLYVLPYSNQQHFWFLNLAALAFPFLALVQLGFLLFWSFAKKKLTLIPVITLLLCLPFLKTIIGISKKTKNIKEPHFTVATWNVHLFDFYEHDGHLSNEMLQKAKDLAANVLMVQELVFSLDSNSSMSMNNVKKKLGFKYAVTGNDRRFGVHTDAGTREERYFPFCLGIFSNYPIIQWQKVQPLREYNHTFIWADMKVGKDTIRFFNIHLQSMHFVKQDYDFVENIDNKGIDEVKRTGKTLIKKMKNANLLRAMQMNAVKEEVLKSPHPVILCGDFNDVPNSYAYETISDVLKDTHVKKGYGIGRTFQKLSPTLRIDYIFCSRSLKPLHNSVVTPSMSDHRPVKASFSFPSAD
jgi:endonuclease/exonuclease/phosphatase family metal-dependent hydrolase